MNIKASPNPLAPQKPKMRGVSHEWALYLFSFAGVYLVSKVASAARLPYAVIYSLSVVFLFAASTLYHRPNWTPGKRAWLRKVDHTAIYFLIAGTMTPVVMLLLPKQVSDWLIWVVWGVTLFGVVKIFLWPKAPRFVTALVYVIFSLSLAPYFGTIMPALGWKPSLMLVFGGVIYIAGAISYAFKKPDPWPTIFGYHEIFHAAVIVGAGLHFGVIFNLVTKF